MAKEGKDLVKAAVEDAKSIKAAALAAAKHELMEAMSPAIKALLEKNINSVLSEDKPNDQNVGYYGKSVDDKKVKFQEEKEQGDRQMKDEKELDMESLSGFFPQMHEESDGEKEAEPELDENGIPTLGEKKHDEPDGDEGKEAEDGSGDDEIEISEAELRKVYETALQTEVQVKKGFSDVVGGGELEQAAKETGILDKKNGEKQWAEEDVPAKQDFTVKEALKRGLAENKRLREALAKSAKMIQVLGAKLHEVNLFNAKVLHVNRILNAHRLTSEQKNVVLESIDKARNVEEVKTVYETLESSFAANKSLTESRSVRPPKANAQRSRSSGTPKQEVLSESVDGVKSGNELSARFKELAGLVK